MDSLNSVDSSVQVWESEQFGGAPSHPLRMGIVWVKSVSTLVPDSQVPETAPESHTWQRRIENGYLLYGLVQKRFTKEL